MKSKITSILIPGMKNTSIATKRLSTLIFYKNEFDLIFDYKSCGKVSDFVRLFKDYLCWGTDAEKRLVYLLDKKKPKIIYAHSHGGLLLYNVLQKIQQETLDQIKVIKTFGSAKLIPKVIRDKNIDTINFYNEKDYVLGLQKRYYPDIPNNHDFNYRNCRIKIIKNSNITDYDVHINRYTRKKPPKVHFSCTSHKTESHKIPCYKQFIKKNIRKDCSFKSNQVQTTHKIDS